MIMNMMKNINKKIKPSRYGGFFYATNIFINKNNMKKIIRLTESDLKRIVKRVIKEDDDEMGDSSITITVQDIFREVKDVLNDYDGYDESMRDMAMDLSEEILGRLQNDLSEILANYITDYYGADIQDIFGNEDEF